MYEAILDVPTRVTPGSRGAGGCVAMGAYQTRREEAISPKCCAKRDYRSNAAQWGPAGRMVLDSEVGPVLEAFLCLPGRSAGATLCDNLRTDGRLGKSCGQRPEEGARLVCGRTVCHFAVSLGPCGIAEDKNLLLQQKHIGRDCALFSFFSICRSPRLS